MKKKILIIIGVVILVAGIIAGSYFLPYRTDKKDTADNYSVSINSVGFANDIESAIPQTEIYNMITNHFNSALPEGKTEKKAIIIGYDGCRADALTLLQKEESAISMLRNDGNDLYLAYCGGVNYPETNTQDTSTAPGWCSVLTGKWASETGVTKNDITKSLEHKTLFTSLTEEKTIDSASFTTIWKGHFSRKNATYLAEKEYCEEKGLNVAFNLSKSNDKSAETVIADMQKADCADFTFVIFEGTDKAGHQTGFTINNPKYQKGFEQCEKQGYDTINAIKNRSTYDTEDWLIIITSDHGGFGVEHGGETIQERMIFIISNKEIYGE